MVAVFRCLQSPESLTPAPNSHGPYLILVSAGEKVHNFSQSCTTGGRQDHALSCDSHPKKSLQEVIVVSWKWEGSQLDTLALEPEKSSDPAVVRPFIRSKVQDISSSIPPIEFRLRGLEREKTERAS